VLEDLNGVDVCEAMGGNGVEVGVLVGVDGMGVLVGRGPAPYSHAHSKPARTARLRMH
jgi:hypothetical protein